MVQALAAERLVIHHLEHLEGEDAIVNIDELSRLNHGGDVLVVEIHVFVITGGGIFFVGRDVEDVALLDGDVLVAGGVAGTNLGPLGVEGDGDRTPGLRLFGLAGIVDDGLVILYI